jgi:hypothetical protein
MISILKSHFTHLKQKINKKYNIYNFNSKNGKLKAFDIYHKHIMNKLFIKELKITLKYNVINIIIST